MPQPTKTAKRSAGSSDGFALATVMVVGLVMFIVMVTISFRSISGLGQVSDQRRYTNALHTADSGIDSALFRLIENRSYASLTPAAAGLVSSNQPDSPFPGGNERDWALSVAGRKAPAAANGAATSTFDSLVSTPNGEWAVVLPTGQPVVYAVGFIPSRSDPKRIRVLRADYDFPPFSTGSAVLTGGSVTLGGNTNVSGPNGSIHSNGNVSWNGGSWSVSGTLTATGTFASGGSVPSNVGNPAGSGAGVPSRSIPTIIPRDFYRYSQYDLCPDGRLHVGPAINPEGARNTSSPLVPCAGAIVADPHGWSYGGGTWSFGGAGRKTAVLPNYVFYAYRANINVGSNAGSAGTPWTTTLIAEGQTSAVGQPDCPLTSGDITMTGNPTIQPKIIPDPGKPLGGIMLIAGRDVDLRGTGSSAGLNGAILAHEQFSISGNFHLDGNIIANDLCDSAGSPVAKNAINLNGSSSITLTDTVELPLGKLIRVTRWLEL